MLVKCKICGTSDFYQIISLHTQKNETGEYAMEERYLECKDCGYQMTKEEVENQLVK